MTTLSQIASFDPLKLAMTLAHLPRDAVVFALTASGPAFAIPIPSEKMVTGQYYYDDSTIGVWTGAQLLRVYRLAEVDGKPCIVRCEEDA